MTLKEFLDRLDAGEWGELHVLFFEHLRKDVLQELWDEHQERATLLILAADLPAEVRAQVLPTTTGCGALQLGVGVCGLAAAGHRPRAAQRGRGAGFAIFEGMSKWWQRLMSAKKLFMSELKHAQKLNYFQRLQAYETSHHVRALHTLLAGAAGRLALHAKAK